MNQSLNKKYNNFYSYYSNEAHRLKRALHWVALWRLLSFVAAVLLTYYVIQYNVFLGLLTGALVLIVFVFFVLRYFQLNQKESFTRNLMYVNRQEIEALRGNIENFDGGSEYWEADHPYLKDLELFGHKSLFQFLNRTCTYTGKNELANWLYSILGDQASIRRRQNAVRELKDLFTWRQKFLATGKLLDINTYNDTQLISWAKERSHGVRRLYYQLAGILLPILTIAGIIASGAGYIPFALPLILIVYNRFVLWQASKKSKTLYQKVTKQVATLKSYQRLFQHIEGQNFESDELKELKEELFVSEKPASKIIKKLTKISDSLESGNNFAVDILLNSTALWNVHHIIRLEKWHSHYGEYIERWIKLIGKFDAYISMANFSYNHPEFTYPDFTDKQILYAEQMGHPLINDEYRVCNDFYISRKGKVFIITGANMAGKSTFLRTVGVNMILGMSGAPVCAENMEFKITDVFTSMNITDSLSENESYFYAEVKRLKQLIDEAMSSGDLLVLLDEILTGTNTKDKETASKAFLERLLEMEVTSLIATHDLSLTSLAEKYPDTIYNKSFEVDMVNQEMHYDYKIREGVAKNMNALDLLRQMKLIK
ncbi:MAG: MutS-related protein [Bacteroidota bacterium]